MSPPPYHLRQNKAADRLALIETISRLQRLNNVNLLDYTYFGMGGPYLEDFRLLYEFFPQIRMVSIENDEEVHRRQKFHRTTRTLRIIQDDVSSFISRFDPKDRKTIFWLDYTQLKYTCFQDFQALLGSVEDNSVIKLTLPCDSRRYWESRPVRPRKRQVSSFRRRFSAVLPDPSSRPPRSPERFASLLQQMVRVAAEQELPPAAWSRTFVPLSSFCYSDGTWMFTLTGIVCDTAKRKEVVEAFEDWALSNLSWYEPRTIKLPYLSTKERLHVQRILPVKTNPGKRLRIRLGYLIEDNEAKSELALEQYAAFHRYSPYFIRGNP